MEGTPTQGADPHPTEERFTSRAQDPPQSSTAGQPPQTGQGGLAESRTWLGSQGLARPREGRMIAGVCAGLARRYDMPVFLVRVLTVAAAIAGLGIIVYLALWVLMPRER
jgi:phage shock protein PspC (stress-responsive transcriptional regulator)